MRLSITTARNRRGEHRLFLILAVTLVMLLAAYLRFIAVSWTAVNAPYRSDAAGYYNAAYNLRLYHVFSRTVLPQDGKIVPGPPDAYRTPGYPLFLSLFVDSPPDTKTLHAIEFWQAALGTVTVLLVFLLMRPIAGPGWALLTALLTAMSPHLVNATVDILSETLFTFLLLLLLLAFTPLFRHRRGYLPALFVAGLLMGAASLTRPMLEFFPLPVFLLLLVSFPRRQAWQGIAALMLGFALLWGPWIARNYITLGRAGDPDTMLETMASGIYPDIEFNHDPRMPAAPNRQDPRYGQISSSVGSIVREVARRVRADPAREIGWYLIGKPVWMWSWNITEGGGDAYIYPVMLSPYKGERPFVWTHDLMKALHWPLVLLALCGCILVWTPLGRRHLEETPLLLARLLSLALFYNTAVLMIMTPWVRYSIPFLPLQYGMAAACLYLLFARARRALARQPAAA